MPLPTAQGLSVADIPAAIVVHELIGLGLAVGWWTLCFAVQPSARIVTPVARLALKGASPTGLAAKASGLYTQALTAAERQMAKLTWLSARGDPRRLTVSLAESIFIRGAIKPVT